MATAEQAGPSIPAGASAPSPREYVCVCTTHYRVSGGGRHRIYWPDGVALGEPVMDGHCVSCGRMLPGKQ